MSRRGAHWAPVFEGITTSTRFADLPTDAARTFYLMLQTKLDDWGKCTGDSRKLGALVWPLLGKSEKDTVAAVKACRDVGLIELYPAEEGPFLFNIEHEAKAGTIGKRDHRRASNYPDHADLAPIGPDWPGVARSGPRARARAARASATASASSSPEGSAEGRPIWEQALATVQSMDTPAVREAAEKWRAYRAKRRFPVWGCEQWVENLSDFSSMGGNGPNRFVAAVHNSSARNKYQSLVEPKGHSTNQREPTGVEAGEAFLARMRQTTIDVQAQPA